MMDFNWPLQPLKISPTSHLQPSTFFPTFAVLSQIHGCGDLWTDRKPGLFSRPLFQTVKKHLKHETYIPAAYPSP
jgi:hypothetical protein